MRLYEIQRPYPVSLGFFIVNHGSVKWTEIHHDDIQFRVTHGLQLQSELAVGDFEWSSNGLEVVDQHAVKDSDEQHKVK